MANTDISYLNPTAMAPKFGWMPKNELAGMEWAQNARDYRDVLDQQMRLQAISEEERRMGLEQKKADLPLQNLGRQLAIEGMEGTLPHARTQASEASQTAIEKAKFDRQATYGDEALKAAVAKHKQEVGDMAFQNWGRAQAAIVGLIEQAKQMPTLEGVEHVKRNSEILRRQGLEIPNGIENPQYWDGIYNAAYKSIKFSQELDKMEKEYGYKREIAREGNASAERIAGTRAEAQRDSQQMRMERSATTLDAQINQIINDMQRVTSWKELTDIIQQKYIPALSQKFDMLPQNENAGTMAMIGKPEQMDNYERNKKLWIGRHVEQILRARGFKETAPTGETSPRQPQGQRKPLGSFDK